VASLILQIKDSGCNEPWCAKFLQLLSCRRQIGGQERSFLKLNRSLVHNIAQARFRRVKNEHGDGLQDFVKDCKTSSQVLALNEQISGKCFAGCLEVHLRCLDCGLENGTSSCRQPYLCIDKIKRNSSISILLVHTKQTTTHVTITI